MSLSLLQGYSSAEEGESDSAAAAAAESQSSSSDDDDVRREPPSSNPNAAGSLLPSAFDAFSQVSGPPQFLSNSAPDQTFIHVRDTASFHDRRRKSTDLPRGAVMEAKAQLVGIHERVRSDIEGSAPTPPTNATLPEGVKRVVTATNPDAKDASELLMVCLQCGVPKTYTNARGMVCPECGDRPPTDDALKKKGSTVKDKEKVKRMRGQSSHASWKSETEMHLRQQFD